MSSLVQQKLFEYPSFPATVLGAGEQGKRGFFPIQLTFSKEETMEISKVSTNCKYIHI